MMPINRPVASGSSWRRRVVKTSTTTQRMHPMGPAKERRASSVATCPKGFVELSEILKVDTADGDPCDGGANRRDRTMGR
jgi:hypothetical protein